MEIGLLPSVADTLGLISVASVQRLGVTLSLLGVTRAMSIFQCRSLRAREEIGFLTPSGTHVHHRQEQSETLEAVSHTSAMWSS